MNKFYTLLFLLIILGSCKSNNQKNNTIATVKLTKKEHNFGKVHLGDTIRYTFKVKNISKTPFIINEIGTSCGCTTSNYTKTEVNFNEFAEIETMFVPNKEKTEKIKESIVIDCNVESGFLTFYLTGEIE